jgi:pSer/pThr/pTyr-binding forkhead associated (FHA) protein
MRRQETGGDSTQMRTPSKPAQKIPHKYSASIVIIEGRAEGMEYPLTKAYTVIGRDRTADIVLQDSLVSRQHAAILYEDNMFILKDLESTNGVVFKGKLVQQARLENRDKFHVGDTTIQFILDDQSGGKVFEIA